MEIKELQKEIEELNARIRGHFGQEQASDERVNTLMLKLGEEYGELCEAVLESKGVQRKEKLENNSASNVEDELADLVVTALSLAVDLDLDVEKMIVDELDTVRGRFGE